VPGRSGFLAVAVAAEELHARSATWLSPLQKLLDFLYEPYSKGKSLPRFFLGNETEGIVYDAMPFAPHLIEDVDIVMKFLAKGNFGKLNGSLVLSLPRSRPETVGKHQGPCSLQDGIIGHAEGPIGIDGHHRLRRLYIAFGQRESAGGLRLPGCERLIRPLSSKSS
jgi:hypothetical protein